MPPEPVVNKIIETLNEAQIELKQLGIQNDDAPSPKRAQLSITIAQALLDLCQHTQSRPSQHQWIMQTIELLELERFRAFDLTEASQLTGSMELLLAQAYYQLCQITQEGKFRRLSLSILKGSCAAARPEALALLTQIHVLESKTALSRFYLEKLTQHAQFEPGLIKPYAEAFALFMSQDAPHLSRLH